MDAAMGSRLLEQVEEMSLEEVSFFFFLDPMRVASCPLFAVLYLKRDSCQLGNFSLFLLLLLPKMDMD